MRNSWRAIGLRAAILGFGLMVIAATGCDMLKPKEKKAFNEACEQDIDCESGQCAAVGSICTKDCKYDRDCGSGLVCRATGTSHVCSKPVGQAPSPNSSCTNLATDCQHNHCIHKTGDPGPGICSQLCETAADCPAGMKICGEVTSDTGGVLRMCLPGDEKTPVSQLPKFAAPKPVVTPKPTASATATATATPTSTAVTTTTATAEPTATASATATTEPTASATATASATGPTFKDPFGVLKKDGGK